MSAERRPDCGFADLVLSILTASTGPSVPVSPVNGCVVGSGVEDATVRVISLNELVTMNYKAYLLGTPQPIPAEDRELMSRPPDPSRRRGSAGGEPGMLAAWRYYCSLAGEGLNSVTS